MGGAYEAALNALKQAILGQPNVATAQNVQIASAQNGWPAESVEWSTQQNALQQQAFGVANQRNTTLLSGMPVPSPVSHAKQQADAKIVELLAKIAALEAAAETMGERLEAAEASLDEANARMARLLNPPSDKPHPLARAVAAWPGRGGRDQWSGMPLSVGRWVK